MFWFESFSNENNYVGLESLQECQWTGYHVRLLVAWAFNPRRRGCHSSTWGTRLLRHFKKPSRCASIVQCATDQTQPGTLGYGVKSLNNGTRSNMSSVLQVQRCLNKQSSASHQLHQLHPKTQTFLQTKRFNKRNNSNLTNPKVLVPYIYMRRAGVISSQNLMHIHNQLTSAYSLSLTCILNFVPVHFLDASAGK